MVHPSVRTVFIQSRCVWSVPCAHVHLSRFSKLLFPIRTPEIANSQYFLMYSFPLSLSTCLLMLFRRFAFDLPA